MPAPGKMSYWYVEAAIDEFPNLGFEDGTSSWQILNTRVSLNGGTSILGWPTPTDPTPTPSNSSIPSQQSPGDAGYVSDSIFTYSLVSDAPPGTGGAAALKLESSATVNSGAILYGPAVISERRISAAVGDTVEFSWRALSGAEASVGDAYNPFAYMLNRSTGQTITLLDVNATGVGFNTNWQTSSRVIQPGEAGEYHFIFICGSFDATFGQVVGSALLVDNVQLIKAV